MNSAEQASIPASPPVLLPGARALLKEAFSLYRERFGVFVGIVAVQFFATFVVASVLLLPFIFSVVLNGTPVRSIIPALLPLILLLCAAIALMHAWGMAALLCAIRDRAQSPGIIDSYRNGLRYVLPLWLVWLLGGFITFGGFTLFIVPGIIVAIWFSLAMFPLIMEDLRGANALLKSKAYVKGMWVSVLWRFFVLVFFGIILTVVATLVLSLFLGWQAAEDVANALFNIFGTPFMALYAYLLYDRLKSAKGEFVFAPSRREKVGFSLLGIWGLLVLVGMVALMIMFWDLISSNIPTDSFPLEW